MLFTAVWGVSLLQSALSAASTLGLAGAVMLLPLAWIPLAMLLSRRLRVNAGRPPTLLVLRVFQQDARRADHVRPRHRALAPDRQHGADRRHRPASAARWTRTTCSPSSTAAGATRFIASPAQVPARLAEFDLAPDPDGRYRVNECYCFDSTWQAALAALVQRADVVLMDLRGFQARNAGCRHELGVLAHAPAPAARGAAHGCTRTDRAAADSDIGARTGRAFCVGRCIEHRRGEAARGAREPVRGRSRGDATGPGRQAKGSLNADPGAVAGVRGW